MKFKVEIGGFVSTYRQRTFIIHAANESEAAEKANDRFVDAEQKRVGNMCDGGIINEIVRID